MFMSLLIIPSSLSPSTSRDRRGLPLLFGSMRDMGKLPCPRLLLASRSGLSPIVVCMGRSAVSREEY